MNERSDALHAAQQARIRALAGDPAFRVLCEGWGLYRPGPQARVDCKPHPLALLIPLGWRNLSCN
jgi:hypothetical protein